MPAPLVAATRTMESAAPAALRRNLMAALGLLEVLPLLAALAALAAEEKLQPQLMG